MPDPEQHSANHEVPNAMQTNTAADSSAQDSNGTARTTEKGALETIPSAASVGNDTTKQPQVTAPGASPFPDGGARAWLTVLGTWCVMTSTFGWIQSVGIFQAHYEATYLAAYSHSEVSWIVSLEGFCFFAGGLFAGAAHDAYGPRWLILVGTLLHVFGLMMTSLSTRYYQFILAQGLCSPIGAAMVFYPALASLVTWFLQKRAAAIGLAATGSGVGGILFPSVAREMIADVGFPWTMRTCAFLILFLCVVANLTVRSRLSPSAKTREKPDVAASLKDTTFLLVVLTGFFMFLSMWLVFTFIVTTAIVRGVDPVWAWYLVPIMNAGSIPGRLVSGIAADKFGPITMYCVISIYTFLIMVCLWIPVSGQAGMIAFAVFFGFGSGGLITLSPAAIAHVSDVKSIGLRTGLAFTATGIACLFGSPAGGAVISAGGYRAMQGFSGGMAAMGCLCALVLRFKVAGFDLRKKT